MKLNKTLVLSSVLVLMFLTTELTLSYVLPLAVTDINTWFQYFIKKDALYDVMFCLFFLVVFWSTKGFTKSICLFGAFMAAGSAFDKQILGVNQYLLSDIILITVATTVSLYKYFKNGGYKSLAG